MTSGNYYLSQINYFFTSSTFIGCQADNIHTQVKIRFMQLFSKF